MGNRGKITVFLCLLISSFMLLGLAVMQIINIYVVKGRTAMCARTAISGIKAEYNRYIFEHYHILLFDKTCGGLGEAYLEEKLISSMQQNLGEKFEVREAAISDIMLITDNECEALKQQISDYIPYLAMEYGAEQILDATGDSDGTLPQEVQKEMEEAALNIEESEEDSDGDIPSDKKFIVDDPRDYTASLTGGGLMRMVIPENMELSDRTLTEKDIISKKYIGFFGKDFGVNNSFDSYNDLKTDLNSYSTWKDVLSDAGYGITYAHFVYNCATNRSNNDTAVMGCEQEYLICGMDTDYNNLKGTIKRIIAIRLPVDYAYLLSDVSKMEQVKTLAWSLCLLTGIPEPILKYLLAGCWSYAEAVSEVRCLLEGNRMSFTKNESNWITDLDNLEETICVEGVADNEGLSYEDYLMILMSMNTDNIYYRMLDLMQINARQETEDFCIENGATGICADIKVDYGGKIFSIKESGIY